MESTITYFIVITIIVFLLLTVSIILFFNYSQRKLLSEQEKNHQQKMTFQKEMLAKTIATQEEERSRIARELHDDLSSKLNVINMNVELLKLKNQIPSESSLLEQISEALSESIERSRRISHELMPPILEKFGLWEALQDLGNKINATGSIAVEINGKENMHSIRGTNKLHIFRIVQELCNNTLKHANARNITLECTADSSSTFLRYRDDGKGMGNNSNENGLGMMNIESRIQLLGGGWKRISVEQGVCFELIIPNEVPTNLSR